MAADTTARMPEGRRQYRLDRVASRRSWYIGPWLLLTLLAIAAAAIGMSEARAEPWAWAPVFLFAAWCADEILRTRRREATIWAARRDLRCRFENGRLRVASPKADDQLIDLGPVVAIDALEERGEIVRLLVDARDGSRAIYEGFDDMRGFCAEFRAHAPRARFRRVRVDWRMRVIEVR